MVLLWSTPRRSLWLFRPFAFDSTDDVLLFHFPHPNGRQHYLANKKRAKQWKNRSHRALDFDFFPRFPFQLALLATKRVKVTHIRSHFWGWWGFRKKNWGA